MLLKVKFNSIASVQGNGSTAVCTCYTESLHLLNELFLPSLKQLGFKKLFVDPQWVVVTMNILQSDFQCVMSSCDHGMHLESGVAAVPENVYAGILRFVKTNGLL